MLLTPHTLPLYPCLCPFWNLCKLLLPAQKERSALLLLPQMVHSSSGVFLTYLHCKTYAPNKREAINMMKISKNDHSSLLSFWILIFMGSSISSYGLNLHFNFLWRYSSYLKTCCFRYQEHCSPLTLLGRWINSEKVCMQLCYFSVKFFLQLYLSYFHFWLARKVNYLLHTTDL